MTKISLRKKGNKCLHHSTRTTFFYNGKNEGICGWTTANEACAIVMGRTKGVLELQNLVRVCHRSKLAEPRSLWPVQLVELLPKCGIAARRTGTTCHARCWGQCKGERDTPIVLRPHLAKPPARARNSGLAVRTKR